jgi:hypothetical protein
MIQGLLGGGFAALREISTVFNNPIEKKADQCAIYRAFSESSEKFARG